MSHGTLRFISRCFPRILMMLLYTTPVYALNIAVYKAESPVPIKEYFLFSDVAAM